MSTLKGVPDSITDPLWEAVSDLYTGSARQPSQQGFADFAGGFFQGVRFSAEYPKLVRLVRRVLWTPERYDLEHEEPGHVHPPNNIDVLAGQWADVVYPPGDDDDAHLDLVKALQEAYEHAPAEWDADWDLRDLAWERDDMRGADGAG